MVKGWSDEEGIWISENERTKKKMEKKKTNEIKKEKKRERNGELN